MVLLRLLGRLQRKNLQGISYEMKKEIDTTVAVTEGIAKDDKDSQNIAYWEMKWSG
jgi:hypothetical protein